GGPRFMMPGADGLHAAEVKRTKAEMRIRIMFLILIAGAPSGRSEDSVDSYGCDLEFGTRISEVRILPFRPWIARARIRSGSRGGTRRCRGGSARDGTTR